MAKQKGSRINRREFLQHSALAAGTIAVGAVAPLGCVSNLNFTTASNYRRVIIQTNKSDDVVSSKPVQWAIEHLRLTLADRKISVQVGDVGDIPSDALCIRVDRNRNDNPEATEVGIRQDGSTVFNAMGSDVRGVVYAVTEAADIVKLSANPIQSLAQTQNRSERPANAVRSCMRMFCTDVEDKGWYNDKDFWREYLTMLVANRFNRVNLSLGLGYDAPSGLADSYFFFAYPFLLSVPGYDVKATNLPDSERDKNLEMLRFISDEAALRGLQFQIGLWTHAYVFTNSPNVNHRIEGLTADTHPKYCRDALALLIKECPSITGATIRIHGESGVPEGSYEFWAQVFQGLVLSGRKVELDMHAKGMDQGTMDAAINTGLPVTISPKYWAEHMGLPYHQAAIRPMELPVRQRGGGNFASSNGARSFLRYGYGDLLAEDRKFGIIHRMWPGTQHLLLWGDPEFAAAYGRSSSFCGSLGCEIMEPLSFKGRKGSGLPGHRTGYADKSLIPSGGDFEKYRYSYRLWGRLLYNPDAKPEVWQRQLKSEYGDAAAPVEVALSNASRILPLFTTAHTPAAANNNYEPEMYVNMSIISETANSPYGPSETPAPRRFGTVSPLDPQLFARVDDYVDELLKGESSGKYSPLEVATWLEDLAWTSAESLAKVSSGQARPVFRRLGIDVSVQIGLGQFFAHKFRAAMLYAIHDRTGDRTALDEALKQYRAARQVWAQIIEKTKGVYVDDVTFGSGFFQRGNWADRLPAIDKDIAAMEKLATGEPKQTDISAQAIARAIQTVQARSQRPAVSVSHTPPQSFRPGQAVAIQASAASSSASLKLFYRHTQQAEPWQSVPMTVESGKHTATIPTEYSKSPYPLEYYFEVTTAGRAPALYPGLGPNLATQPYYAVRQSS